MQADLVEPATSGIWRGDWPHVHPSLASCSHRRMVGIWKPITYQEGAIASHTMTLVP